MSVTRNDEFASGIDNSMFDSWHKKGIRLIWDVYRVLSTAST